jgi:ubiquinone/menaquinone biosynthesis C-methylase UbiE
MDSDYIKINRNAYEELIDHYRNRRNFKSKYEETSYNLANFLLRNYPEKLSDARFLEVGPGSGEILSFVEKKVGKSVAVEISQQIISLCKEIVKKTKFIHGNVLDIELPDKGFDLIYLGAIIHLFPKNDAKVLISKLKRSLSDHGLIFINTTISDNSSEGFFKKEDSSKLITRFRKFWTEQELLDFVNDGGFRIIEKNILKRLIEIKFGLA